MAPINYIVFLRRASFVAENEFHSDEALAGKGKGSI